MLKFIIRLALIAATVAILTMRCATISPPSGGPRDSLAPVVLSTTPTQYSTNFKGQRVTIQFNEFVQIKDQKTFFVSPPGDNKPLLTVKGKSIVVEFEKPLDSTTTYRLDFGNSISDNNEGNTMDGFSVIFSTGGMVDSLMMVGQAVDAYTRDSVIGSYIFFFDAKADSSAVDSTIFKGKTEALFRTDSSGYFVADILKQKSYRVYAMLDKNGNQKYEAGTDFVGFVDNSFDPTQLGGFTMSYDSIKRYTVIDSLQVVFDMFKEIPRRRQMLVKHERPMRQKLSFAFNTPDPRIDTLRLDGIDPEWIIQEKGVKGDSLYLWINPPTKEQLDMLKDTIRGYMVYQRQDSVMQYYPYRQNLTFSYKEPVSDKQKADQKAAEQKVLKEKNKKLKQMKRALKRKRKSGADTTLVAPVIDTLAIIQADQTPVVTKTEKPKNPFKFSVDAAAPLNPERGIRLFFDYPLVSVDSSRIELIHTVVEEQRGARAKEDAKKREVKEKARIRPVPGDMHRWVVEAKWKAGDEYKLMIPAGVFVNIAQESNDTLKSQFKIALPEKYGTFIVKSQSDTTIKSTYIYELISGSGEQLKIEARIKGVVAGQEVPIRYIPMGNYRLRIIEDLNGNDIWDTGVLTERKHPEKVRIWIDPKTQSPMLMSKENWEIEVPVDLKELFGE